MSADQKHILSQFGGHKKRIPPNKKQRTVRTKENGQYLADRVSYYNQEEWLEEFLEDEGIFYNDSSSDSETYDNESSNDGDDEQEEVFESFNINSQLINDFAVCKHCGGKHL